jgi:predicted nucleic acid-binding protein
MFVASRIGLVFEEQDHSEQAVYEKREDKEWGLTDCISFTVMSDHGLRDQVTGDRHFAQAGFRALMLPRRA